MSQKRYVVRAIGPGGQEAQAELSRSELGRILADTVAQSVLASQKIEGELVREGDRNFLPKDIADNLLEKMIED